MSQEEWDVKAKSSMFKEILAFKKERKIQGYSILQVIMMYCEENDLDVEEVGDMLKKDKSFRESFQEDLQYNHEATFSGEKQSNISEWI